MKLISSKRMRKRAVPYLFLLPASLLIIFGLGQAFANVLYYSLQNYNGNKPWANGFAGLENFVNLFTDDPVFFSALGVSLKWVFFQVLLQLVFGMMLALVLNQKFRGRGIARTLVFMPWAISGIITGVMWGLIYNEHIGVLNDVLRRLGLIQNNIAWLGNERTVFGAVVVAELWRGIPFFAIMLLAGLQAIPDDLYEAAGMDGAGVFKKFFHVTLPFLKDTIILSTLLRAVWEFNNVDVILNLTNGGPSRMTTTLSMYVVNQAIDASNFGYGSAVAVVGFIILFGFSVVYLKSSRFGKED